MNSPSPLLEPAQCALLLIDQQAGLAFAVGSSDRQVLLNNTVALARTADVFDIPVIVSTSASKVYSGPLMPPIQAALPDIHSLERRNMNLWEDDAVREAVVKTQRRRLLVSGLLTEACVSFPVLSALAEEYEVYVVADACGGTASYGERGRARDLLDPGASRVAARLDAPRDL
jgi:nicotinamidase-related amidase